MQRVWAWGTAHLSRWQFAQPRPSLRTSQGRTVNAVYAVRQWSFSPFVQAVEQGDAAQAAKAVEKSKQAAAAAAAEQGDEYNNLFDESEDDEVSCCRCITASCNALHGTGCKFYGSCGTLSLSSDSRQPKAAALHLAVTVLEGDKACSKESVPGPG